MNIDPSSPAVSGEPAGSPQAAWWFKPLVWSSCVALLYLLRDFFLIGFLTFLVCFVVRGLVRILARRIAPHRDSHGLELVLTVLVFLLICLGLYALGRYFVPQVLHQGRSMVSQLQNMTAADVQNSVLQSTVGTWQFRQQFGSPEDARYQQGLAEYLQAGRNGEGLYQAFPQLDARVKSEFESNYEQAQTLHLRSDSATSSQFDHWFLTVKAPQLFEQRSDYYLARWLADFTPPDKSHELASLQQRPDFESYRDEQIRQAILTDIKTDPVLLAQLKSEWAHAQSARMWAEFRQSTEYQAEFEKFYQTTREQNPDAFPIEFSYFQKLAAAYARGKDAFLAAVHEHDQADDASPKQPQYDFEAATKLRLGQQWWGTSHVADWVRDHAKNDGDAVMQAVVGRVDQGLSHFVRVPLQVVTALILSIFILIDWHGLNDAVTKLRQTRLGPVYDEIVPSAVVLGRLIGKSFQGQVIIALLNAAFTLAALRLIGVEYSFILSLFVFLFSFVPVVGVILSGIPICLVAILQPGGTILMVLQVILAIAVIHLIEGMVLSPRIIGKIGHLHPILVIVILLVAEHFFGIWGLILGVPVAIYLIRVIVLDMPIPGVYEPAGAPATIRPACASEQDVTVE